jgi:hypothetical protein
LRARSLTVSVPFEPDRSLIHAIQHFLGKHWRRRSRADAQRYDETSADAAHDRAIARCPRHIAIPKAMEPPNSQNV